MSKAKKIVSKAGTVILCLVVIVAVIFLVFQIFASKGIRMPGGYRPLIVLSGSMEPAMPTGSLVVSKGVDPTSVKVGDIVTYSQTSDASGKSSPFITHRVVEVIQDAAGLSFVTKGDANNSADVKPIVARRLVGRVVLILPFVGRLSRFVHTPLGLIMMILLPGGILVGWEGLDLVKRRKKMVRRGGTAVLGLALCLAAASQAGLAWGLPADTTEAYFVAAAQPVQVHVTVGTWETPHSNLELALSPGTAKAVRPSQMPGGPASFPIASVAGAGAVTLDFGELNPGNTNNSPDVFHIKNTGSSPVTIKATGAGGFQAFVVRIRLGGQDSVVLQPGDECSVDIKLGVAKGTVGGEYRGAICISSPDGSSTLDVPALVTVTGKGNSPKEDGEDTDSTVTTTRTGGNSIHGDNKDNQEGSVGMTTTAQDGQSGQPTTTTSSPQGQGDPGGTATTPTTAVVQP